MSALSPLCAGFGAASAGRAIFFLPVRALSAAACAASAFGLENALESSIRSSTTAVLASASTFKTSPSKIFTDASVRPRELFAANFAEARENLKPPSNGSSTAAVALSSAPSTERVFRLSRRICAEAEFLSARALTDALPEERFANFASAGCASRAGRETDASTSADFSSNRGLAEHSKDAPATAHSAPPEPATHLPARAQTRVRSRAAPASKSVLTDMSANIVRPSFL